MGTKCGAPQRARAAEKRGISLLPRQRARNEGEGDTLFIEKLNAEAGEAVTFDKVLAVLGEDKATFGAPVVEGAKVSASVVKNGKGKKVMIFKYNPKKGYRRRQGHRQPYTKVQIEKIEA